MSLPIKAGIGVLTAGSIAGASYAGVSYLSKEDKKEVNNTQQRTAISKLIEEEYKFKLLDTSEESNNVDESHWAANWKTYKTDNNGRDTDILGLEGWNKTTPGESTVALKRKCKTLATKTVQNISDSIYQNVTAYCGRGVTVEEEATKKGAKILKTNTTDGDSKIWEARQKAVADLKSSLNLLGITGDNLTAENIRTGCGAAKSKNRKEAKTNYQEIFDAYLKVCTKQQGDPE